MAIKVDSAGCVKRNLAYISSPEYRKKMQNEIMRRRKNGTGGADIGLEIITEAQMMEAAEHLKSYLREYAAGLPASVYNLFNTLSVSAPSYSGDTASMSIQFTGDLFRPSLINVSGDKTGEPTGSGIDDIVMLFNDGYEASGSVRGFWPSANAVVWSKRKREGTRFLIDAIVTFNMMYGDKYHCKAMLG